jgi:general secretion pathway protein I
MAELRRMQNPSRNAGFSLLEVVFALAILGGAIVVLGEVARTALKNAEATRDMVRAQLLCESKLSEIISGLASTDPVQNATLEQATDSNEAAWLYSVETNSLQEDGLLLLQVTVTRDQPAEKRPVRFSLQRWIPNPDAAVSLQSSSSQQSGSGTSSGGGGSQ